jgi:ParB family chromosome partitioning protein
MSLSNELILQNVKVKPVLKVLLITELRPGRYQPRQYFDKEKLQFLAETIKRVGVLVPIIVKSMTNNRYEIIAGERRWRAAQLAGVDSIPCLIGNYSDEEIGQISLIENLAREDLNPIEKALGFSRLIDEYSYTHEQASEVLGIPRTQVTNSLRLLKLDNRVQEFLGNGELSEAQGKSLAGVALERQYPLALECVQKQLSSRALDKLIKKNEANIFQQSSLPSKDLHTVRLEQKLSEYLGHAATLSVEKNKSGQLTIRFHNMDALQGILDKIGYLEE